MRRAASRFALVAALLPALALAGCSEAAEGGDGEGGEGAAALRQADEAARAVDVAATATTGVIRGSVVDQALRPVEGALVRVAAGDGDREARSNAGGAFGFDELEAGTYFLTASKPGYSAAQVPVDVVAGVGEPEAVRMLLEELPGTRPFIEAFSARMHVSLGARVEGAGSVTLSGVGLGSDVGQSFAVAVSPNGTVAQSEFAWEPTTPATDTGMVAGGTYAGNQGVDVRGGWAGTSPIVAVAEATVGNVTADVVVYTFWPWRQGDLPAGVLVDQSVDAFVHVFHNFRPDSGWTFTADGPHPLPE